MTARTWRSVVKTVAGFVRLESTGLTVAFALAVGMVALAFLACPYPPMIDYPQHVAMGALLHDLWTGAPYATDLYKTSPFTYNAGIETSIGLLSFLMSPELAGRVILAVHVLVFAAAALSVCHYANRPRWYALLAVPLLYNHITGWGFSNFVVALPLMILAAVGWMRIVDGDRAKWRAASVLAASLIVAYTHVLVMLSLCVIVAVVSLEVLLKRGDRLLDRVVRLLVPGAILVPSVGYSMGAWFWARATSTTVWEHSWAEGQDDPLWSKLRHILFNTTGNFADGSDQHLVALAFVLGAALWLGEGEDKPHPRMRRLALVFFGLYALIPKVFIATFHIYQRFLPLAAVFAIAAIPVVRGGWSRTMSVVVAVVALVTGTNVLYRFLTIPEMGDAMAIIDDAPAGKSLAGVMYDVKVPTLNRELWVHLPALYQVRKQGVLAYSFLRNESVPVHYLPGKEPPRPPGGFEWNGQLYDFEADYARSFDLLLVRSWVGTTGEVIDPAPWVFKGWQDQVRLLSRRGQFFLYDASEANGVMGGE